MVSSPCLAYDASCCRYSKVPPYGFSVDAVRERERVPVLLGFLMKASEKVGDRHG